MDPMVFLNLVLALAAVAAAIFAFVQAKAATDSRKDAQLARDESRVAAAESVRLAGEANDAFTRQAEAQEESNRLRLEEMTPADWSDPVHVSGSLWRVKNTSRGVLLVSSFEVQPDGAETLVSVRTNHQDGRYEYGDSFEVMVVRATTISAEKLTVMYRREHDAEDAFRSFHIGL